MERDQVFTGARKRLHSTLSASPTGISIATSSSPTQEMNHVMKCRAIQRAKKLKISSWNGHIELTDECKFGLAIFELFNNRSGLIKLPVNIKQRIVPRNLRVYVVGNTWGDTRITLFRKNRDISISNVVLQQLSEVSVEKYISEYSLISQLLMKMRNDTAVQNRWLPSFSPSILQLNALLNASIPDRLKVNGFQIRGQQFMKPNTIGQWFMTLLIERVRRRIASGIGLRALFYCICWCTRLIQDRDFQRLEQSAIMIKTWLLYDTCRDCLYKYLRELREEYSFEYVFNIADSFSQQIKLPDIRTSIEIANCQVGNVRELYNRSGFLRTMGEHSFLTSPYARTSLQVEIQVLENQPKKKFFMTGRQTTSLLSILDIHARVLRADDWNQSERVFMACIAERCANDGTNALPVLCQIVEDLCSIRRNSPEMHTTVSHLATLLFHGKINTELLSAYNYDSKTTNVGGAHGFIVRHCFLRAPCPDIQCLADSLFDAFEAANPRSRLDLFSIDFKNFNQPFSYELLAEHANLEETWGLTLPEPEESIDELIAHGLEFMSRICAEDSNRITAQTQSSASTSSSSSTKTDQQDKEHSIFIDANDLQFAQELLQGSNQEPNVSSSFREVPREIQTSSSDRTSVVDPDETSVGHLDPDSSDDIEMH